MHSTITLSPARPVPRYILSALKLADQLSKYATPPPMNPIPNPRIQKVPITRDDYSKLSTIVPNPRTVYAITGPTGCGKSTFALLALLPGRRMIIICPSQANAANLLAEFNQRIPNTAKKLGINVYCPKATLATFTTVWDYDSPLLIMTTQAFLEFVNRHRCFPPCDLLVNDEYHLQGRFSTETRFVLMHTRSAVPDNDPTIIMVSATPPDEPPPPPRLSGITFVESPIPDVMTRPVPDIYIRSKHPRYSNNYLLIVTDSCESAHSLHRDLTDLGENVFLACACPTPSTVDVFLRTVHSETTVITTPDTESGMTFPCSHMVNPGTASTTLFERRVVIQRSVTLSLAQANQRAGRAGRSGHTILFTAPLPKTAPAVQANPVVLGGAYLLVLHLTRSHPRSPEAAQATALFPRLKLVKPPAASICRQSNFPLLEMYRHDNAGNVYKEYGGTSTTFAEDNSSDLVLFKWPSGSAYAPFLNTLADHNLTTGMNDDLVKSITEQIASSRALTLPSIDNALTKAEAEPATFTPYLWQAFKAFDGKPNLTMEVKPTDPLTDFKTSDRTSLPYMLTASGCRAWEIIHSQGGQYNVFTSRPSSPHSTDSPLKDTGHRQFVWQDEIVEFSSIKLLNSAGSIEPSFVEAILLKAMRPVLITHASLSDPSLTTDLVTIPAITARSSNSWLNSLELPLF